MKDECLMNTALWGALRGARVAKPSKLVMVASVRPQQHTSVWYYLRNASAHAGPLPSTIYLSCITIQAVREPDPNDGLRSLHGLRQSLATEMPRI